MEQPLNTPSRELHIAITDVRTGQRKVDLRLPLQLAAVALRSGARLLPPGHDPEALVVALENGTPLDLNVVDQANGERVVITINA